MKSSACMDAVDDESVDFFITSPPYWNLKKYGGTGEIGHSDYETYLDQMNRVWAECFRCGKSSSVMVVNVNSRRCRGEFYPIAFDIVSRMVSWKLHDVAVWYLPNALPQPNAYMERLLDNKFEYVLTFKKSMDGAYKFHKPRVPQKYKLADPRDNKNSKGRCLGNVLRIPAYRPPNIKKQNYHVAAYPEELVAFLMECYTDPGDVVLDPFLGSGTTLKVARVMKRRGIGYEVNEKFAPLIAQRIREAWQIPDWRNLDILHSTTMRPGAGSPRKAQFTRQPSNGRDLSGQAE